MGQMAGAIPAAVSTERRKLGGVGNALCAVGSFACELVNEQRPPTHVVTLNCVTTMS